MKSPGELHGPFIDVDKGHKVCTVCDQLLTNKELDQYCTGKGYYARSSSVPANLKTEPTWREKGYRPARGETAKAWLFSYVYGQGHFWARLWDEKQVVAIKRRSRD